MNRYFLKTAKWTSLALLYYILWFHVLCTTFQKTLSGNPPGDMPVIVIVLVAVVVGMGWRYATSKSV